MTPSGEEGVKSLELWPWERGGKFPSINRYFFLFLGNFLMGGTRIDSNPARMVYALRHWAPHPWAVGG